MSREKIDEVFGRRSHVTNYSGYFETGANYKQFDFVYNTGDGLFYYAREDLTFGGGVSVTALNRYHLVPDGPNNDHYIVDSLNRTDDQNASFYPGNIIDLDGSLSGDGRYRIISVQKDVLALNNDPSITGSAIQVRPVSENYSIEAFEEASSQSITISTINADPSLNPDLWSTDLFFFDADYGSSASFKANNYRHQYGNGYYIVQPKSINSLSFEVDLKFKNRTNREANAIIHFVENHLGQLEKDSPSPNLRYKQGISGFRWDGASSFHPYDTTENQSKTFYCNEFNHSLNFENSNDVSLKIRNLDTSLLRRSVSGGWIVGGAETYDPTLLYEKNDIAFYTGNLKHYYWHSDSSASNKPPAQQNDEWTRSSGNYSDINKNYWTRDFFWKPSLGLEVQQNPRVSEISVRNGYTQVYEDGINESLLKLNLNFNNREDDEARAILHFLEQHYGCIPFNFSPPAPYETTQNFICEEWTHTYNHKNNHSISATFEQYPFNMDAEQYSSLETPPILSPGELIFTSPIAFSLQGDGEVIVPGEKCKARLKLQNIGDTSVTLNSASVSSTFSIVGQIGSNVPAVLENISSSDYIFQIPSNGNFPFNLAGRYAKLSKAYTHGLSDGGQMFTLVNQDPTDPTKFITDVVNGVPNTFFQNNRGEIRSGINEPSQSEFIIGDYVVEQFFKNNTVSSIPGGDSAYIDVVYAGVTVGDLNINISDGTDNIVDASNNEIVILGTNQYNNGTIQIDSSTAYSPQEGILKVFVGSEK